MTTATQKITMKTLARQKAEVRAKIVRQHNNISRKYWDTIAPFYRLGNSPISILGKFSTGFAVVQGIITSLRMVSKVRNFFRR